MDNQEEGYDGRRRSDRNDDGIEGEIETKEV